MPDTIKVSSPHLLGVRVVVDGNDAVIFPGINESVDAALFRAWGAANPDFVGTYPDDAATKMCEITEPKPQPVPIPKPVDAPKSVVVPLPAQEDAKPAEPKK